MPPKNQAVARSSAQTCSARDFRVGDLSRLPLETEVCDGSLENNLKWAEIGSRVEAKSVPELNKEVAERMENEPGELALMSW